MMMLAMTREGAQQIVDNLRATVGRRELTLGLSYQRHRAKGPVIVLNSDTVMTNVTGLSFLNVEMHARLWESLLSQDWDAGPHVLDLDLQALQARVLAHRLDDRRAATERGNRSKAASLLGIGRTTLYRKLHALGIDDDALLS